jgi:hypothetical protein
VQVAAIAARRGLDPLAYLAADDDEEALILRAIAQRAETDHGEERRAEVEYLAKLIAVEVSKLLAASR